MINDAEELVVTRSGHDPVVIVSLAEYQSMKETEYLLRNPNNAAALRRPIAELELGTPPSENLSIPTLSGTSPEAAERLEEMPDAAPWGTTSRSTSRSPTRPARTPST
jgi:antitoxin YefM